MMTGEAELAVMGLERKSLTGKKKTTMTGQLSLFSFCAESLIYFVNPPYPKDVHFGNLLDLSSSPLLVHQ